jgi:hypothetical protein
MKIEVLKSLKHVTHHYGDIPLTDNVPSCDFQRITYDPIPYWPFIYDEFCSKVNLLCDTLLDISDLDYFDIAKCKLLLPWLEEEIRVVTNPLMQVFYKDLIAYTKDAIRYGTGVLVEL